MPLTNALALHDIGIDYAKKHDYPNAIDYFKQSIQNAPSIPEFHNNLANAYKKINLFDFALIHYFEALKLNRSYFAVYNNLGGLYYQQGDLKRAILAFKQSLDLNTHQVHTHFNLGLSYVQNNELLKALPHFQETFHQDPTHQGALHNLGIGYTLIQNFTAAKSFLDKAIAQDPTNIDCLYHLAITEMALRNNHAAQKNYQSILTLDPTHADAHYNLATLYLAEDKKKALEHFTQALKYNPSNKSAEHLIDSLTNNAKTTVPEIYVQELFDQYASNYNHHMVDVLGYHLPLQFKEIINNFFLENQINLSFNTIVDLGCGTGLCAAHFTAQQMIGVDLSSKMLNVARKTGYYNKLVLSNIVTYLQQSEKNTVDLILCAEVIVYFSELSILFQACTDVLKLGGLFCFSIEVHEDKNKTDPYYLTSTGRYTHHNSYIHKIADQNGFICHQALSVILRHNKNTPVKGMIYLLQKAYTG